MSNFEQLLTTERTGSLSVEEREFVEVHKRILVCGEMTGRYFVEMCHEIKHMRDGKLYRAAGFDSFGEYTETALKIKERQAYNYAKAAEDFTDAYLEEHAQLGITKLGLLAKLTDEERKDIEEKVDLSDASTKELEDAVKAAQRERDEAQKQLDLFTNESEELKAKLAASESEKSALQQEFDRKKEQLEAEEKLAAELTKKKKELEKQLKEAKTAKTEIKTVEDEESKKLAAAEKARADELEQKLRETSAQLAAAREQKRVIASDELLVFKVKFEEMQRIGEDISVIFKKMDEETVGKCRKAITAVLNGWKEDMGL